MSTNDWDDQSTIVEIGARLGLEMIEETDCHEEQNTDIVKTNISTNIKIEANKFRMLCNNVQNCFAELDNSMFELLSLKDKLLLQRLPLNVSSHITLVLSRLYRTYSESHVPVFELVRLVQIYSEPYEKQSLALKTLYDNNEMKRRLLNLAFQRLTSMECYKGKYEEQKSIDNWEKMYVAMALRRSNVRQWKFRIKTFREKALHGYEHVIEWLQTSIRQSSSQCETFYNEQSIDDRSVEELENVNMQIVGKRNLTTNQSDEDDDDDDHDDDDDDIELRADTRNSTTNSSNRQGTKVLEHKSPITSISLGIQVQPDVDNAQTSTDDIRLTKSLIMRIYRPLGIMKTKFKCIVYTQGQKFMTDMFTVNRSSEVIDEKTKNKTTPIHRTVKFTKSPKKHIEQQSNNPSINDINTVDMQQTHEFLIPMPNVFKRRSLFQDTGIDHDSIRIDIYADEQCCGSVLLSSEDLHMLELPKLYNSLSSYLIATDDSSTSTMSSYDFDEASMQLYQMWINRTPNLFSIYNRTRESVGKLPLIMFWYHRTEQTLATKYTMTMPIEIEMRTEATSPMHENRSVERIGSSLSKKISDEEWDANYLECIESIKVAYENEIDEIHKYYQAEIVRLRNLVNGVSSNQSNQVIGSSQLSDHSSRMHHERQLTSSAEQQAAQTMKQNPSKNFLERYELYLEQSTKHRQHLIEQFQQETALENERRMEILHRLHRSNEYNQHDDDNLCLPAVFMPIRSRHVFNPKVYQCFHSIDIGSTDPRLTHAPTIIKFPPVPQRSVSVLNLFELSRRHGNSSGKDNLINDTNE